MSFQRANGSPNLIWVPVDCNNNSTYVTIYNNHLVKVSSDGCAAMSAAASGAADATGEQVIDGICVGNNNRTPLYSSTYNQEYITSENGHTSTTERVGMEGYVVKGDKSAYVLIDKIFHDTLIKGSIFNAAYGTAPTVGTVSAATTNGTGVTTSAIQPDTPVADLCSIYFRSGLNRGIYRITTDTSATSKTVSNYLPFDTAIGDTLVGVPMRTTGWSYVNTDAVGGYLNSAANPATDYFVIFVRHLDLRTAGQEVAYFYFADFHLNNVELRIPD